VWRRLWIACKQFVDSYSETRKFILVLIELTEKDHVLWQNDGSRTSDMGFSTYLIKDTAYTDVQFFIRYNFGARAKLFIENEYAQSLLSSRSELKDLILAIHIQLRRNNLDCELEQLCSRQLSIEA
jgi:hypothetical protein